MRKQLTAAILGTALIATAIPALAGEGEGVVASVDPATRTIILEDGSTWTAGEGIDVEALAAGDTIKVAFEDGTTMLTMVEKVE